MQVAQDHISDSTDHPKSSARLALLVRGYELPERLDTASYVERTGSSNARRKDYPFHRASKFEFSFAAPFSSRPKEAALLYHG